MSSVLKNTEPKSLKDTNKNAFSPVPSADSFPWKKVDNTNNNLEELKSKIEPPKMEKKKDTLYSAYDSFLDDKRNTFLSESSYNFDTLNRNSYMEESEYEPIVENQMAIITNEQPKPQRYSMLSALAPLTKRVSLDKPKLTPDSQTQDSLKYSEEETSSIDYSYVSYESDYEAIDDSAQPIVQNQLDVKTEKPKKEIATKSLEKKIEENIEKYKKEDENVYESASDSEIEEEDFSLRFQRESVRDSKDVVAEAVAKKLKEINDKEEKEQKEEKPKSKGQIEREKAAEEAKAIEALKPSYVGQTQIKPTINEITPQMVVDAEKEALETAEESITNIKPQFVKNALIQPNVASLTDSMIKPPTQSIYLTAKEIAPLGLGEDSSDNILSKLDSSKLEEEKKDKGKEKYQSDEEIDENKEELKNVSDIKEVKTPEVKDINKPLLTAPQIEPPRNMAFQQQQSQPSFLADDREKQIKVLEHPNPLIYSGYLEKLSTHGRFQRRLFRFDGLILTCLSQNKQKIPGNLNLLNFEPIFLKDGTQESTEIVKSIGKFYKNDPVMPEIINPLVALEKNISPSGIPDLKAHQYYYPKWMLNIQDIESIQPLLSIQNNGRPNNDIAGILNANNQDQNELTFIITTKTISYILRAPNNRDFNRWMYILNRMKETFIELNEEVTNPIPHIERPRFKGFPPPPNNPPPPELQAKRYRNCQDYVKNNLGFSLSIPQSAIMEINRPLVVQVCMDIKDPFYRRIALLKIWNICFTDLLSIDNNVSFNAVIIPVNKAIMAKDGPKMPPMSGMSGPSMNIVNSPGGMIGRPEGMPQNMNNLGIPHGLMSPSMNIKSGTKNDLGIPIATPGLLSPSMKPDMNPMSPPVPSVPSAPGMGTPMGVPGLMSPPMGQPQPGNLKNGPMSSNMMMNNQHNSPMNDNLKMDEMKQGMDQKVNDNINRKNSTSSSSAIESNIKDLMNYGKHDDDDSDDEFYLPKKEDGSLKPFIGRNSVIGNTNSLLHFKKLSLMDVGGDFNSLYRALNNEKNNHQNQKPKFSKQGSTDHFAQELEMLDNMNSKSSQQINMNNMGINTRQVNMTNIIPGVSKTTSMINSNDESIMTEDISVDFPAPPNPYGQTSLGTLNSRYEKAQDFNNESANNMSTPPAPISAEKINIPVDPELLHCLTAMLRIIHRLSGSCFREEQKSFESVPPPVPKWYYQFCVKSFPSFAKLSQTHVINYLECMEEQYIINGHQELPQEYLRIQEALESFIKATRAWERVVNDWKRDIIHRKHLNHRKISFDDDDSIMKVVRINDVLRVNLLLKDHIEENARKETSKLRKFFQPPQQRTSKK
ncbi:hypothetical protein BCR36DRAFT_338042 [Piromyces finnis]|uniref:PH domain-containing protein n=1 Tax=Piromyces finnis TaxID=1754191 RepID=A0A1Y1UWS1_9FUNG|nr:hypothetical protein BCR36DRAFT_338042 [Piromyces finnis]|eukprot:ORX42079.1 hypothetical protein BCR36DRAFT_338042 [Piromyces finnis]